MPFPMLTAFLRHWTVVLSLGATGCFDCDHFESRGADIRVQLSPPGAEIEQFFGISVEEIRGLDYRSVRFSVSGSNLRWHVRGAKLLQSTGEKRVLFEILLETPSADPNDAGHGQVNGSDLKVGTWEEFLVLRARPIDTRWAYRLISTAKCSRCAGVRRRPLPTR